MMKLVIIHWIVFISCNLTSIDAINYVTIADKSNCKAQFNASHGPNPDIGLSVDELLIRHGYPVTKINVTTEDGYILTVYRIPYSPRSPLIEGQVKKAVILSHGLGGNALCWLIQYGTKNLAMLLSDSGFDVFLLNYRGTSYSPGHINPKMNVNNVDYWDFSIHEIAVYDVPAVIEMVTKVTTNPAMYYIGHSMGTTTISLMLAERPEYNERILTAFLLAPGIYYSNTLPPLKWFFNLSFYNQYLFNKFKGVKMDVLGMIEKRIKKKSGFICASEKSACGNCANTFFMGYGYDGPQMNYTTLGMLFGCFPESFSTKSWTHFTQFIKTDQICQFNYGFKRLNLRKYGNGTPPCYNFENIAAPIVIFWSENDFLPKPEDVKKTVTKFPKAALKEVNMVKWPLFNHMDFIIAKDADILVYNHVLNIMTNATYE